MDDELQQQLADVQARWEHGHDELIDDCALCQGEYGEAFDLIHGRQR